MARTKLWASRVTEQIGAHQLVNVKISDGEVKSAVTTAASMLPRQYASGEEIAGILRDLGKPEAASFIEGKLPTTKTLRSGELGEILGTHYAAQVLGYRMVARLRWKDSRKMAMRGDDLVGVRDNGSGQLEYLKGEAKSRMLLTTDTLGKAQEALFQHQGRPAAHTLSFLASRLREMGESTLSTRIHSATLKTRIPSSHITHYLFTLSGNSPNKLLREHTKAYTGKVSRRVVGMHTPHHQTFIKKVYEQVIRNARTR